jgi:hypothetical protein
MGSKLNRNLPRTLVSEIIFNWMYSTSPVPVRNNVAARTAPEKSGIPRCNIVHACDSYPVRWADKVGYEDINQGDLTELVGAVLWLNNIIALYYLGIMNLFGTPFSLRLVPIINSFDYPKKKYKRQVCNKDLTNAPCISARLDD